MQKLIQLIQKSRLVIIALAFSWAFASLAQPTYGRALAQSASPNTPTPFPPLHAVPLTQANADRFALLRSVTLENFTQTTAITGLFTYDFDSRRTRLAGEWNGITIWDTATGKQLWEDSNLPGLIAENGILWGPNDKKLLAKLDSQDGFRFLVWDVANGVRTELFKRDGAITEHNPVAQPGNVLFTPDSTAIVSIDYADHRLKDQNGLRIWNIQTGKGEDLAASFGDYAHFISFSPSGLYLVDAISATPSNSQATSPNFKVMLWNWKTRSLYRTFTAANMNFIDELGLTVDFSADGKQLTVHSGTIDNQPGTDPATIYATFDVVTGKRLTYHAPSPVTQFSKYELFTQTDASGQFQAEVRDAHTHNVVSHLQDSPDAAGYELNPDETLVVAIDINYFGMWDAKTGEKLGDFNMRLPMGFNSDWSLLMDDRIADAATIDWYGVPASP